MRFKEFIYFIFLIMISEVQQDPVSLLKKCIDNFFHKKGTSHGFFLVSGPKEINKTDIICNLSQEYLNQFFYHDFLWIRDCSHILNKTHILKVESPNEKEKFLIPLNEEETLFYQDLGVREINLWLQQSPLGHTKILFIENIERINIEGANAFLKNLEEPLPNRLIIASVSHHSQVLDTILSRALVIKFHSRAHSIRENFEINYQDTIHILQKKGHLVEKYTQLKKIYESGSLHAFLDGWIAYCVHHQLPHEKRLETKKMMNNNLNIDNLLLYPLLE